jgi:ABC-type branched-subunit amino acid transport system ATPase component
MLSVKNITVHYGKAMAIEGVSLEIAEGGVVTIIGANGSGKSTILRAISGLTPLTSGEIWFQDHDNFEISRAGIMTMLKRLSKEAGIQV